METSAPRHASNPLRVVIVCLEFARAQRMRSLAEGLTALGHDVVFLTSEPGADDPRYAVVAVPYSSATRMAKSAARLGADTNLAAEARKRGPLAEKAVRLAARATDILLRHPDKYRGWIGAMKRFVAESPAALEHTDLVIASTPPPSALFVGRLVADHCDAPLIYDFRDLWTDNPSYSLGPLRKVLDRIPERRLVDRADALTTVTGHLRATLAARFTPPAHAIYTGVDPKPWRPPAPRVPDEAFRLGHFGVWYAGRRTIRPLAESIRRLADAGTIDAARVRIEMFGLTDDSVTRDAEQCGLSGALVEHGWVDPGDMPAALTRVDVALLLAWPKDVWSVPLKTHHYLAAGKSVLVLGASPDSELARLLEGTEGVTFAYSAEEVDAALTGYWRRWSAGESLDVTATDRMPVTAESMASRFAELAEEVTSR